MRSVIRWNDVLQVLGYFSLAVAASLIVPLLLALGEKDAGRAPLAGALAASVLVGCALIYFLRGDIQELNHREGIILVVLAWLLTCLLGALPFYFSPYFPSFTDAFFESISGFTTTGATVLSKIEVVPRSLLFWRSFTHWLGGMGIILLGIAILPLIGTGGMELYRAEFSGASSEKLKPRIAETAFALWRVYVALSIACFLALLLAGMGAYDALCHTFATLGTGGFSTRNASIESFGSPAIEMVLVLFMFLAGINFTQHYRLLVERRPASFFGDREIRVYAFVTLISTLAITLALVFNNEVPWLESARLASFQVVSILTTTGFSSADFEIWNPFSQLLLLALMFAGGCTGSTAGGLKIARIDLLLRVVRREFRRLVERRGIFAVHSRGSAVSEQTIQSLLNLVYLSFIVNFGACLILTAVGVEVLTAISAVAACMFNIGPGLGDVGPAEHYGHLPAIAKWTLSLCMLAGRLEFYVVLVILTPAFWKR